MAGTSANSSSALTRLTLARRLLPRKTCDRPAKLAPRITTPVTAILGPLLGSTLITTGAEVDGGSVADGVGKGVWVRVGVAVGVTVTSTVLVAVAEAVSVVVGVAVASSVLVGVGVAVVDGVTVGTVGTDVKIAVLVGVLVGISVGSVGIGPMLDNVTKALDGPFNSTRR